LTKLHNDERPSVKSLDLLTVVLAFTRTDSSYRTVQPLAASKMRTADLRNVQWVSMRMLREP